MQHKKIMFENIIGYDEIKSTLKIVVDTLKNPNKYRSIGCNVAHGLLLYGPPGTGKTTLAKALMSHVKRQEFIVRKTQSDGDFVKYLNTLFAEAKEKQPSIILLDDLDKFSEENNKLHQEEYVAVQSLIDDVKDDNVFIIATANEIDDLPDSLLRAGRFDIKLFIDKPKQKDALKVFEHYLLSKKIKKDINTKRIASILTDSSCADLEKVCNQAGIYAAFKNKSAIGMEELIRASLELKHDTNIECTEETDKYTIVVAYHEAGHVLVGELLEPGSVSFVTANNVNSDKKGFTIFHDNENYCYDIDFMKNKIKYLLAGRAATEVVSHKTDVGSYIDMLEAFKLARRFANDFCMYGFTSRIDELRTVSERTKQSLDDNVNRIISGYYDEVKEMLIKNRDKLDALANELNRKKILFQDEIEDICNNTFMYVS